MRSMWMVAAYWYAMRGTTLDGKLSPASTAMIIEKTIHAGCKMPLSSSWMSSRRPYLVERS